VWETEEREELILLSFLAALAFEKLSFKALERSLQFIHIKPSFVQKGVLSRLSICELCYSAGSTALAE